MRRDHNHSVSKFGPELGFRESKDGNECYFCTGKSISFLTLYERGKAMKWFLILALLVSCHSNTHRTDRRVLEIFSDFNYVGSGAANFSQDGFPDTAYVVPHGEDRQPRPDRLVEGTQYVFHYRDGVPDNEAMGLRVLPERLRRLGYTILEAPNYNGGAFMDAYIGGPYFRIRFSDGEREGIIFNQRDGEHFEEDHIIEDYVLVFLR